MKTEKPEIVFTFPGILGGVSSFNYNIINHSKLICNFYSKVILLKEANDKRALFSEKFNVDEQLVFEFSERENQFHLQSRLNKFLGTGKGAIITDNGLTIEAARRFNNPKTIFSLIHDYYYVNQQVRTGNMVDVAIAHSSFFRDAVFASSPTYFANRVFYIPYGVKQISTIPIKNSGVLNLVFLGRLEDGKGVMRLFEIQQELKKLNIDVRWSIIGKGSLKNDLKRQWSGENISFFEPDTTAEVYKILSTQDIFVFPTIFEGTPVAILECLANAVVIISNDLPGGIRDIVNDGVGYRCGLNNISEFVKHISTLHHDRALLKKMQENCFYLAHKSYDVNKNADEYFELFLKWQELHKEKKSHPRKLAKLDLPFFPNNMTKLIRRLK
jgi:glycosyltransferase involved in cell wall biosynthesis